MKTLQNVQIEEKDGRIIISGEVKDMPYSGFLTTRTTHGYVNPENMAHGRHIQSSNEAIFVRAAGCVIAIPNDVIIGIASVMEPATTFAPIFRKGSKPCCVKVISESRASIQWQISDAAFPESDKPDTKPPEAVWSDIAGAISETLDESLVPKGRWLRCVAKNTTGTTISRAVQKV